MKIIIPISPMGAPRMTRSDKWKRRPCVMAYRAFRDALREHMAGHRFPECGWHMTFYFAPPKSWPAKKRAAAEGTPHKVRPDKDNCEKAVLDALFETDSGIWDGRTTKRWSAKPRIEIEMPDALAAAKQETP